MAGTYSSLSGKDIPQRQDELKKFIKLLQKEKVTSYLEVGARYGDTFYHVSKSLPEGSKVCAVDLVDAAWGRDDSREHLEARVEDLKALGYDASVIFGDSTTLATRNLVAMKGPFHAALIDGDHRFEGLTLDWVNYGKNCKLVAFHDIDGWQHFEKRSGARVEVPEVWSILKRHYKYVEFVGRKRGMGIGVLWV